MSQGQVVLRFGNGRVVDEIAINDLRGSEHSLGHGRVPGRLRERGELGRRSRSTPAVGGASELRFSIQVQIREGEADTVFSIRLDRHGAEEKCEKRNPIFVSRLIVEKDSSLSSKQPLRSPRKDFPSYSRKGRRFKRHKHPFPAQDRARDQLLLLSAPPPQTASVHHQQDDDLPESELNEDMQEDMTSLLPERFSNNEIGLEEDLETVVKVAAEHFYCKEVKWNFLIIMEFLNRLWQPHRREMPATTLTKVVAIIAGPGGHKWPDKVTQLAQSQPLLIGDNDAMPSVFI
ncbi:hypothetical protein KSP39_PZI017965 [Platanthera zijinensis]|uniref:Uncharacterized protein n=1 Tax=Platanthera zijinensis TaxID=2320716 RepID=A0AAP0B5K3_9ASPA